MLLTFKEFILEESEIEDDLDEVLSIRSRMKLKRSMRKNKSKIKMGQRRAKRRMASSDTIKRRAQRQARSTILKKILKGKSKSQLSYGARASVERRVNRRAATIKQMVKRILPKVRKADRQKLKR